MWSSQMWSSPQSRIYEHLLSPGAQATWVLASHPGRPCKSVLGSSGPVPEHHPTLALPSRLDSHTLSSLSPPLGSSVSP